MLLVLKLEQRPHLWAPLTHFEDVLEKDRFCTIARWKAFKRAADGIPRKDLLTLGVAASCLIAVQPKKVWFRILNAARKYRATHDLEPTYQYITKLIGKKPARTTPTRKELLAKIARLEGQVSRRNEHILKLEGLLRKHRIRVPPMKKG